MDVWRDRATKAEAEVADLRLRVEARARDHLAARDERDAALAETAAEGIRHYALRVQLLQLADEWQNNPHEEGPDAWHILNNCANDVRAALDEGP